MPATKKQTRRSISVMGTTYMRLDALAKAEGRSVSGIIEEIAKARCDAAGIRDVTVEESKKSAEQRRITRDSGRDDGGGVFTF